MENVIIDDIMSVQREEIFKARILPNTFFMLIPTTVDKLPFKIAVKELKQLSIMQPHTVEVDFHVTVP